MQFGQRLKELRTAKGISQAELAEKIYVSRSAVAKWESCQGLPCAQSLSLISEYFGVSYDSFLSESSSETIIVNKNIVISKYKRILIAIGVVCALAIAAVIFMLVYFLRPAKSVDDDNKNVGNPVIDNNIEIVPSKATGFLCTLYGCTYDDNAVDPGYWTTDDIDYHNPDCRYEYAYKLEVGKEYELGVYVTWSDGTTYTPQASQLTLDYDHSLFDISVRSQRYTDLPFFLLVVKEECRLAPIVISSPDYPDYWEGPHYKSCAEIVLISTY